MPEYVYTDGKHTKHATHPMEWSTGVICTLCGAEMWRKPQVAAVIWGGLPPSGGEPAPDIQQHLRNIDKSRDDFEREHDEHERRTADDS